MFNDEEKYPYLTKIFDSESLGFKYHVKIYKINADGTINWNNINLNDGNGYLWLKTSDIAGNFDDKNNTTQYVISSYNINNLSIGLSGNHYDGFGGGGISTGSVSVVQGYLDVLGTSAPGYGAYTPPSFTKMALSGSRNQQLTEDGLTSFYIAASGQMARRSNPTHWSSRN